jgi:beta-glucosidase
MRSSWRPAVGLAVACTWLLTLAPPAAAAPPGPPGTSPYCDGKLAPWLDPRRSPDERARAVLPKMTLDEKIQYLGSLRDSAHFRETPPIPWLCLPALRLNNGSAGVSTGGPVQFPATALPAPIGLAATWDTALARTYGEVAGRETRDQGRNLLEGPDINIARVPVNGRTFEAYGEDPYLAGQVVVANVRGIQSQGVIANAKHYAANNQETNRSTINELIDERTLREIYLPAFEASVRLGRTGSVMCAKNQVNGVFSCQHPDLLQNILRGDWGFQGFVVSDFDSCHNTVDCANNGMEFELPQARFFSNAALRAAIDAGQVSLATIDEHVRRILATMARLGILDRPQTTAPIDAVGHGAISRRIAEQAAVLLKNDANTLPLDASGVRSIAVVGPYAGAAHTGGGGSSHVLPLYSVSPVDGIRNRLGPGVTVRYASGAQTGAPPPVPSSALTPSGQPGLHGLLGEYFPNPTLSGAPQVTRIDNQVDFNFGSGEPAPELPVNMFSVRWTGFLDAPATGDYLMATTSDDGSRLFIDDALVVDNWGNHSSRTVTATVHLDAGPHAVRIEYYDNTGNASVTFGWAPPGAPSSPFEQAVEAARSSDVAVVMVGDDQSEGRDKPNLSLTAGQDQLVAAVAAANPRTVVVVKSGGPVLMPWVDAVPAILQAWYPGEEDGNVVASLLFGDANPSGKLPITFPKQDADVPANTRAQYPGVNGIATYSEGVFMGYRHYDARAIEPLFPFGHGLSYTSFDMHDLSVSPGLPGYVTATAQVTNTGTRSGSEVVQVYVERPSDPAVPQPPRQLAGFAKVTLAPGETKQVTVRLVPRAFAYWDSSSHGWVVPDGTYRIVVGNSSRHLPLSADVPISGLPAGAADALE